MNSKIKCRWPGCTVELDNEGLINTHRQSHNISCVLTNGNTVDRVNGAFPCPHAGCAFKSVHATSLRRHLLSTIHQRPANPPAPIPDDPRMHDAIENDEAMVQSSDLLDELRLAVVLVDDLTLVVCLLCQKGLLPSASTIYDHVNTEHEIRAYDRNAASRRAAVEGFVNEADLTPIEVIEKTKYLTVTKALVAAIPRVECFPGFRCHACAYYCHKRSALDTHLRCHTCPGKRPSAPKRKAWKKSCYSKCLVQSLRFDIRRKAYYGVLSRSMQIEDDQPGGVVARAWRNHNTARERNEPVSIKQVSSWVRESRWDVLLEEMIGDKEMVDVLRPLDLAFETFEDSVLRYIRSAVDLYLSKMAETMRVIEYKYRRLVMASSVYVYLLMMVTHSFLERVCRLSESTLSRKLPRGSSTAWR